jgi:hypothetical protein
VKESKKYEAIPTRYAKMRSVKRNILLPGEERRK